MRIFGEIDGVNFGDEFESRDALAKAGVHPPPVAGISGSQSEGADSIVLSGGYEDDEDFGDVIIYTGAGGQENGRQVADQAFERVNLALAKNKVENLPVRVSRGFKHQNALSPSAGYKYCGLYFVDDYWSEKGQSGFLVWRYRLVAQKENGVENVLKQEYPVYGQAERKGGIVTRIVRDHQKALNVKRWHNYECQVCSFTIKTEAGFYAEAAHIKPLGRPHNGPDAEANLLCLCPNHHVMFDNGVFSIADDFSLVGLDGRIKTVNKHKIDLDFVRYHRAHYYENLHGGVEE